MTVPVDENPTAVFDARSVMRCLYHREVPDALPGFAEREPEAWEQICAELFKSQIATLFFSWLKRLGHESLLTMPMLKKFREKHAAVLAANILMQEQFMRMEAAMRKEGISAAPLKGLELIEGVYDDLGARSILDIDLLVSEDQRLKAICVLRKNGYKCVHDDLADDDEEIMSGWSFSSGLPTLMSVDLHWTIMSPAGVRMGMMSRRQSQSLSRLLADSRVEKPYMGRKISVLRAEHSLLFMLVHCYSHNFSGDKWLWDLPLFLDRRGGEIDWGVFFEAVRLYRLEKLVHSVFLFAERALGIPFIPEAVRLRFAELSKTQQWICGKILASERKNERMLLSLLLHNGFARMLTAVARYFFPTKRDLEIMAFKRLRWSDYPAALLKSRIRKLFRS